MHDNDIQCVSIVIPVFNEEDCLPELIERTHRVCQSLPCAYEILLVDDGSTDSSVDKIKKAMDSGQNCIALIILNRNYGQHAAITAGFEHARGDLIVTLDADLQNPPEEISNLVAAAKSNIDVIGTFRRQRKDHFFRKFASRITNAIIKKTTGIEMSDYGSMLRAYRKHIIKAVLSCHERSTFIPVLANSFARHTVEIEVNHDERKHGESKYSFFALINLMFDLVTCMTTTPLRLLSIVGTIVAGSGVLFAVILLVLRLIFGAGWAADGVFCLFAILFIFIGAQFIGMGLLGEYIGRMYSDVRARPRYFVQEIIKNKEKTLK